jgi:hypothetical protein
MLILDAGLPSQVKSRQGYPPGLIFLRNTILLPYGTVPPS